MSISIIGLLVLIFVPMAQLWARVFWLQGSLDQWWLLIPVFWIFPLSVVPSIMIYLGKVAPGGGGKGPPYDYWMWVPIIMKMVAGLIVKTYFAHIGIFGFILPFILQIAATTLPHYIRSFTLCGKVQFNTLTKSISDAIIENGVADIAVVGIKYVPLLGTAFSIIGHVPGLGSMIDQIIWSVIYAGTYIVINMINGIDLGNYCNLQNFGRPSDQIGAIVLFVLSCILGWMDSAVSAISSISNPVDYAQSYATDYAQNYATNRYYGDNDND